MVMIIDNYDDDNDESDEDVMFASLVLAPLLVCAGRRTCTPQSGKGARDAHS